MPRPKSAPPPQRPAVSARRPTRLLAAAFLLCLLLLAVRIDFRGHFGGLFLLKGKGWRPFDLKDDLYLGEGSRLIAGIDFGPIRRALRRKDSRTTLDNTLELDWNESDGSGHVLSRLPGGQLLATSFGRYLSDDGVDTRGLFVGGGFPDAVADETGNRLSDTGMAWFDGRRWLHIWCSSNEAILSAASPEAISYPSSWRFLGSRIVRSGRKRLVLSSSHEARLDGVPIRIDRFAYFRAGETFFRLGIRIRNEGDRPVPVMYVYGDEPWLGSYGSSAGNVGWTRDGLVERSSLVDTRKHRYFGMFDCGNSLLGNGHDFTMAANFIEWLGSNVPGNAYFCNRAGYDEDDIRAGNPLSSDTRFLGAEWGPARLSPGEETKIFLAIGMAPLDPLTRLPAKPDVPLAEPLP